MKRVLVIGASGMVGSNVVKALDDNHEGIEVVLATSQKENLEKWQVAGRNAVMLDLNNPATFGKALNGIERIFLLTDYTVDMLYQSKILIDSAKDAGVRHVVHLGTYTSRRDLIPHFVWHDMIETYLAASGIAWTNIHPNVITDSIKNMVTVTDTEIFLSSWGNVPQGYACAKDIGKVVATVLREGPEKHAGKDYYLSIDVLNATGISCIFTEITKKSVHIEYMTKETMEKWFENIPSASTRVYMESAVRTMELTQKEEFKAQTAMKDDVLTVTGCAGTSMKEWVKQNFGK